MSAGDQPRSINSQRVPPSRARDSRPAASTGAGRDNPHVVARHDGAIVSEAGHDFRDHLANEPSVYVIPASFGGVHGAIVARFIDFRPSIHAQLDSQGS